VESSIIYNPEYNLSFERNKAIIKDLLDSGHSVELPATGYSMFPTLRPGDLITVKPFTNSDLSKRGCIIVYQQHGIFIMHRLRGIVKDDQGNHLFISRGDSGMKPDKPWLKQDLLGLAVSYKRGKKAYLLHPFLPGSLRYQINHSLLVIYLKIMRLKRFFRSLI
jgi:signal peptidase I